MFNVAEPAPMIVGGLKQRSHRRTPLTLNVTVPLKPFVAETVAL